MKFWQMDHIFARFPSAFFYLICYYVCAEPATDVLLALILYKMRRNLHKTTSGVKFDLKFDFPVPDFLYGRKFWKLDHDFMHF